ncbi:hypothetical protein CP08DC60_0984, partial [Chlamydia psittaci 08DC60]
IGLYFRSYKRICLLSTVRIRY